MTDHDKTNGLVCAWRMDGNGGASPLSLDDQTRLHAGGFDWIHLDATDPASQAWLRKESGLPDFAVDALLANETRPRFEQDGEAALINLRGINHNPGADPEDMVSIRIWATPDRVVTARRHRLMAVQDLREAIARGEGPHSSGEMIARLTGLLAGRIAPVMAELDDDLDACELEVFDLETEAEQRRLSELRFQAVQLRRYITPQREALRKLSETSLDWFSETDRRMIDEAEEAAARVVEELDAARDRASVLHDMMESAQTLRMNRHTVVLSIVAGIFLPLTLIAGMFGMNVGGIPLAEHPNSFWILSAVLLVLGVLELAAFKWAKWI